jgi:hypothetical protein
MARARYPILGLLFGALLLTSCGPNYSLDCGPLGHTACAQRATQIVSVLKRNFPGRAVSRIVIQNLQGDAQVILDDGTEVGFGRRESASD